jgi:hypothetical protein
MSDQLSAMGKIGGLYGWKLLVFDLFPKVRGFVSRKKFNAKQIGYAVGKVGLKPFEDGKG